MHAGRRVALLCLDPWNEPGGYQPFNYAIRCIQAGLMAAPLDGVEIHLVEARHTDADALMAQLEAIDPDVVGASAYTWSFPTFVEIAARLKERRPDVTVIFGGPSARPAMFTLSPYRDRRFACDALVIGDGEHIFPKIIALARRDRESLGAIAGLALPTPEGFARTPKAPPFPVLDDLASPYQMGLVPQNRSAHIESFRGCPLSCTFCQWGDSADSSRSFSKAYLVRQLEAIRTLGGDQAVLVDAGLNLNLQAFRNLAAAEREVRVLRDIGLHFEVYPSHLTDEHLDFLSSIQLRGIGIGLQSYDKEVLRRMQRSFDAARFERVARQLHELGGDVSIEIIMGLPGDSPDAFLRTLEHARSLGCNVRAYHCMVLPDALMTRAPAWANMDFDPETLLMRSCSGWTASDLEATSTRLTELCVQGQGWTSGKYWYFPGDAPRSAPLSATGLTRGSAEVGSAAPVEAPPKHLEVLPSPVLDRVASFVTAATDNAWHVDAVERHDGRVVILMLTPEGRCTIALGSEQSGGSSYRVVGGVAVSYRDLTAEPTLGFLKTLDLLCARGASVFARLVGTDEKAPTAATRATRSLPIVP